MGGGQVIVERGSELEGLERFLRPGTRSFARDRARRGAADAPERIDATVYRVAVREATALGERRRQGRVMDGDFVLEADRILTKLGPGWHVCQSYEPARLRFEEYEEMRLELTRCLGRLVISPPRPAPSPESPLPAWQREKLSSILLTHAARLLVRDQGIDIRDLALELDVDMLTVASVLAELEKYGVVGPIGPDGRRILISDETMPPAGYGS
jgi:hypothetical protein